MAPCLRCSVTPAPVAESGTLCIAPPLAHTLGNIRELIRRLEIPHAAPAPGVLAIPMAGGVLSRLVDGLEGVLTRAELRDTKSLIIKDGAAMSLADLAAMQPLATVVARLRGSWLLEILGEERLTSHFQPIVRAGDPGSVFAYECLVRGLDHDGSLIPPNRLYETARDADLLFPLDRAARLAAIHAASSHGLDAGEAHLFINFNPTSIYDPSFCLRSTIAAIAETALCPARVVFEVVESDRIDEVGHLSRIVDHYRAAGFKVALDDLGSGYGSLNLLAELQPDFVKLDMQLIRGVDGDPFKAGIVGKLLELARSLGIEAVAEGIETEAEWRWLRDHGADYLQGYYIARPGSSPPRPRAAPLAELTPV